LADFSTFCPMMPPRMAPAIAPDRLAAAAADVAARDAADHGARHGAHAGVVRVDAHFAHRFDHAETHLLLALRLVASCSRRPMPGYAQAAQQAHAGERARHLQCLHRFAPWIRVLADSKGSRRSSGAGARRFRARRRVVLPAAVRDLDGAHDGSEAAARSHGQPRARP
jgi:hypothetical protein